MTGRTAPASPEPPPPPADRGAERGDAPREGDRPDEGAGGGGGRPDEGAGGEGGRPDEGTAREGRRLDEGARREGRRQALARLGLLAASCVAAPGCSPFEMRPASRRVSGGRGGRADLALAGATVFAAPGVPPFANAIVVIERGRVVAVGERDRTPLDAERVINVRGAFVTAGLWNCHVHFTGPEWAGAAKRPAAELDGAMRAMLTRRGFTSVIDLGSDPEGTLPLRERVRRGEVRGPAILSAGPSFFPPAGRPFYLRPPSERPGAPPPELRTPAEAEAAVRECARLGTDVVKIFTGSPVGDRKVAHMPEEVVRAVCAEARRQGKPVFAHPQDAEGLRRAVAGGVDVVAHTAPAAGPLPPALLAEMRRAGTAVVPTLTLWHRGLVQEGEAEAFALEWQGRGVEQLRGLVAAGVEVLFGTDVGYLRHDDTADELGLMAGAGMGFDRLLEALTAGPARRFGRPGRSGRVAPGYDADLVVLADDPRQDPRAFAAPRLSLRSGRVLYDAAGRAEKGR
ncbi:MAG TPA: amidohydrolase family protein [Polyangiaceae bacterium]|nr:amidohydrolase family protein [Polyangiaceae bacterium]